MDLLTTVFVKFFAGMGAGLGTGFAGMSAAAVISPLLIHFLGIDPYMAVGIALSSDVLASAISAYTYGKHKNLDIKNGLIMMVSVLLFTVVGSYVSSLVPSATMGNFSVFMTFLLGIKFIVRLLTARRERRHGAASPRSSTCQTPSRPRRPYTTGKTRWHEARRKAMSTTLSSSARQTATPIASTVWTPHACLA